MISVIYCKLRSEDSLVQRLAFKAIEAMAHSNIHDLIFTPGMISAIHNNLRAEHWIVRIRALKTLAASLDHNNLHALIFNPDMIPTIQELLADENEHVKCEALATLVASMDHSETSA
ncbi:hypothetical protein JB92DRAFT_2964796 [Gautieria morchelliformis]|nr:hypothetical protein JB92DRAFT_2964796 [Gautieria morchelliformis]